MSKAINGLKNVESSAIPQFLQPILNMLLRMIGDGGETLQVGQQIIHDQNQLRLVIQLNLAYY